MKISDRKIIVVNQAANYLTIGFCNAFAEQFSDVTLLTGSIHTQGEELSGEVKVAKINKWQESPSWKKMYAYLLACARIYLLLLTRYRKHEVFFVSIPPMGYLLNIFLPNRFSILVWDVYPDVFRITGMQETHWLYQTWAKLNKRSFTKAFRLFTISERMADLVEQYIDRSKIIIQPIWSIFQANERVLKEENPFIQEHQLEGKFIVQYSGNIGLTHKVEVMVELAEMLKAHNEIVFMIIGRGPRKHILEKLVQDKQLPNCVFLPFQSDEMFPFSLSAADLGMVILDELTSKGSVPSKSYNLMSYGIPSLYIAGEDSQLKYYADQFQHAACFSEHSLSEAANFIVKLATNQEAQQNLSKNAQEAAKNFRRTNADKFIEYYLKTEASPQA